MRNCLICQVDITNKPKAALYCSCVCSNKSRKKKDLAKECEWCFESFTTSYIRRKKRFCSKSCSTQYKNVNRDEEAVRKKISETKKRQFSSGEVVHPWIGKEHSEETKKKISKTRIRKRVAVGENNPMFGRRGGESPIYGIERSKETKELMSKVKAEQWKDGKYNGVDFRTFFKRGYFHSYKMGTEFFHRSGMEREVFEILELDENVLLYDGEPFILQYYYEADKQNRSYLPDLLITYRNGMRKLVEIKPEYLIKTAKNQAKFKAAREYCQKHGILFEVWTEKTLASYLLV